MTKFHGAAGIRIGMLISNNINIGEIQRYEPAWKISTFDANMIRAALGDHTLPARTHAATKANREILISLLKKASCVESVFPGCSNYLLVKLRGIDAYELQKRLTPYRILIRNCENFDGLDRYHIRLAIKSEESIRILQKALNA
jgi:threonine-phosphate decarboxylase